MSLKIRWMPRERFIFYVLSRVRYLGFFKRKTRPVFSRAASGT